MEEEKLLLLLSPKRLQVYQKVAHHKKLDAIVLYQLNLELASLFFPLISWVEISIRNIISAHISQKSPINSTWIDLLNTLIIEEISNDRYGDNAKEDLRKIRDQIKNLKRSTDKNVTKNGYRPSQDRYVSNSNFYFWAMLFSPPATKMLAKHKIYLNRIFSKREKIKKISQVLNQLRLFRNRIAHNEPIIFEKGILSLNQVNKSFDNIAWVSDLIGLDLFSKFPPEHKTRILFIIDLLKNK